MTMMTMMTMKMMMKMMTKMMITIVDDWVAAGEDVHVLHRVHRRNWRPTSEEVNFVNAARYNKYIEFLISLSVYKLLRASRS